MATATPPAPAGSITLSKPRLAPAVATLLVAGLIFDTISGTMYGPLLTSMMAETGFSSTDVGWFFNAATLGTVMSVTLTSRMADAYGSRKVLIVVSILAMVGSLMAGFLSDFWPLVIGRFLMGFSAGIPLGWGLVRPRADATQTQRVAVWLGTVTALFTPLSIVLAGLFGLVGLSWRSVTWFIFALFALQLLFAVLARSAPIEPRAGGASGSRLDWVGSIGLGLWATALLLGINAGSETGWTSPLALTYLGIAVVLFAAWVLQQRRSAAPVISFANMDRRQTFTGYAAMLIVAFSGLTFFISFPNMMQNPSWGLGLDPLTATFPLIMVFPGTLIAGQVVRLLLLRVGPNVFLPLAALASLSVTLGVAFAHDSYWQYFLWSFLYGAVVMMIYTSGYMLVASSTRQDNPSSVFGVLAVIQYLAVAIATAIVFIVIAPGPDGFTPESSWISLWVGLSVLLVVMAVVMLLAAPRRLSDRHAISLTDDRLHHDAGGSSPSTAGLAAHE